MSQNKRVKLWGGLLCYKHHRTQFYQKHYLDEATSDITLVVEGRNIPVHLEIITAETTLFNSLLDNDYEEIRGKQFVVNNVLYKPFLLILQYMYSKIIDLNSEDLETLIHAVQDSHRFGLGRLQEGLEKYLIEILSLENVLNIYMMVYSMNTHLLDPIFSFIRKNEEEVFEREELLQLRYNEMKSFLTNERTDVSEVKAFQLIEKWIKMNPTHADILDCINFNRLTITEINDIVRPTLLYDDTFLQEKIKSKGFEIKAVTNCDNPENFRSIDKNYSNAKVFELGDVLVVAFIIELDELHLINNIQIKVRGVQGYQIDVSTDEDNWVTIIDYTDYWCHYEQDLYFEDIEARFIRIITDDFTEDRPGFLCNSFKVRQLSQIPRIQDGQLCPTEDDHVAGAILETRSNIKLYNVKFVCGKFVDKGLSLPYAINPIIDFNQPVYTNTIRFRLWDYDGRKQSYVVKIGTRNEDGILVKDNHRKVDGMQEVKFDPIAVTYVEFKGNENCKSKVRIAYFKIYFEDP